MWTEINVIEFHLSSILGGNSFKHFCIWHTWFCICSQVLLGLWAILGGNKSKVLLGGMRCHSIFFLFAKELTSELQVVIIQDHEAELLDKNSFAQDISAVYSCIFRLLTELNWTEHNSAYCNIAYSFSQDIWSRNSECICVHETRSEAVKKSQVTWMGVQTSLFSDHACMPVLHCWFHMWFCYDWEWQLWFCLHVCNVFSAYIIWILDAAELGAWHWWSYALYCAYVRFLKVQCNIAFSVSQQRKKWQDVDIS